MLRRTLAPLMALCATLSACAAPAAQDPSLSPNASASATPAAAPTDPPTAAATVAPSATPTSATTVAPATPTLNLPTPPPKITAGPTAAPFPLAAGWWDGAVCYEIFVRSFYDSDGDGNGDLNGLIEKLDYVNDGDASTTSDLGANCIWLMPIAEATSYHGYDTIDYYTIEQDYGTNDDFKRLVSEADQRGIKIVIDLVLNHTSSEHPWFQAALRDPNSPYRDFFLWSKDKPRYKGPFNNEVWHRSPVSAEYYYGLFWSGMPDLNYRNPAVLEEAHKISRFWVEEMGVAGFRMDAIKHMVENGPAQMDTVETKNWIRDYRTFLESELPGTMTIGEIFDSTPRLLQEYYPDQMDYYFEFEVAKQIRGAADNGLAGLYMKAVTEAYTQLPFQRWSPFLTNHDQNRVMNQLDDDPAKAKLAAIALLSIPGLPFLYYGEEIGMLGVKPDEDIRTPMHWTKEEGAGFTAGTPWRMPQKDYPVKNVAMQSEDPDSLLNLYRRMVNLHVNTPALANGDFTPLESDNSGVAAFVRRSGDQAVLVLINFDTAPATPTLSGTLSGLSGDYTLTALLGEFAAAPFSVAADGSLSGYLPGEIPAQTGLVFELSQ